MNYIKLLQRFVEEFNQENDRPLNEIEYKLLRLFALWLVNNAGKEN